MSWSQKCVADEAEVVPLDDILVDDHINYVERVITIIDRKMKTLHNKEVGLVKVQWRNWKGSEWTWELEEETHTHYPVCLRLRNSKSKSNSNRGNCNI